MIIKNLTFMFMIVQWWISTCSAAEIEVAMGDISSSSNRQHIQTIAIDKKRRLKGDYSGSGSGSGSSKSGKKNKKGRNGGDVNKIQVQITNLTYKQPFSSFFVMVHGEDVQPFYRVGHEASEELQKLAEDGNSVDLVTLYEGLDGVLMAGRISHTLEPGQTFSFTMPIGSDYPYLSLGAMAVNTNDAFVGISQVEVSPGDIIMGNGYDAGTEKNTEKCASVPGPSCRETSGNRHVDPGEGFIHIHRGMTGNGGLSKDHDWRNPMMRVEISEGTG